MTQTGPAVRILAISGSLRRQSLNHAVLSALAQAGPDTICWTRYDDLDKLPAFNPDLDTDASIPPEPIARLRAAVAEANAVVICTPEYAGGVPGALKNALDWIVSSGEFMNKPTAAISASPMPTGGEHALESLDRTLRMMSANVRVVLKIPFTVLKITPDGSVRDPETARALKNLLDSLLQPPMA